MYVIGVTGGVGSGKSELLRFMKEHYNCRILLADEAAHAVEAPGGAVYDDLVELLLSFDQDSQTDTGAAAEESEAEARYDSAYADSQTDAGAASEENAECSQPQQRKAALLHPDGTIDARTMAALIFSRPELLTKVNGLVHPAVWDYITAEIQVERDRGEIDFFVLEAALLIECGYRAIVDEMWYIYCDENVRRQRLKDSRGYSDAKIDSIMQSQLTEEEFRAGSDIVIDNSGRLEDACAQIADRMRKIIQGEYEI